MPERKLNIASSSVGFSKNVSAYFKKTTNPVMYKLFQNH